jgi:hypothetical protein
MCSSTNPEKFGDELVIVLEKVDRYVWPVLTNVSHTDVNGGWVIFLIVHFIIHVFLLPLTLLMRI